MSLIRPLERIVSPRVLVVGGGIAGMQAALEAAAVGLPVTVVEAGPSLGGVMAQLDKTFPTNDCAMCILSPRMLALAHHPGIEVLTLTRVLDVAGEAGNFRVALARRPRYVDEVRCTGCGECARVCPRKRPSPHNMGLSVAKAIGVPFPQAIPNVAYLAAEACRHFQGKACEACVHVCPAGAIDFDEKPTERVMQAGAIILAPGARAGTGRLFPGADHPNVVTSLEFERLLSSTGPNGGRLQRPLDGKVPERIAFIQCAGSRHLGEREYCSSFCCLASLKEALVAKEIAPGPVQTTLFYMDLRAHGKGYERYLEQARERGVELVRSRVTGVMPGNEGEVVIRYTDGQGRPREAAYDLVVLAVGLETPAALPEWARRLGLAVTAEGFLAGQPWYGSATARRGILACGTAREPRDIAETVTSAGAAAAAAGQLLALAPRVATAAAAVPAEEGGAAPRIGVFLCHCGTNIAHSIDLTRLAASVRELPGVVHVEDNLFSCAVDTTRRLRETIAALGLNRVVVAACSPRTHEAVFREVLAEAGLNPGYLAFANLREQCAWVHHDDPEGALEKARHLVTMAVQRAWELPPLVPMGLPMLPRALVLGGGPAGMTAALTLADQGYEVHLMERTGQLGGTARRLHKTLEGFDPQDFLHHLQAEVYGHLNIRVWLRSQLVKLSGHVGQFRTEGERQTAAGKKRFTLEHGVVIVATGGQEMVPRGRYGYGTEPRVLTQLELEGRLAAGDAELKRLRQVVMIQCVGSREPEHPYCSRLCCSEALKNALTLKERVPGVEVTVLYRDIRAYGVREKYYRQVKEAGGRFLPFEAERPPVLLPTPRGRPLRLSVWDAMLERPMTLMADLVVLSAGVEPAAGMERVARELGIPRTLEGFFLEAHQKLRPVDTVVEGVFVCGAAHYPKSLEETVAQAQAAASRAMALLSQKEVMGGERWAQTDQRLCRSCLRCVAVCPYGAVMMEAGGRPEVVRELCRGCGICAVECPAAAISMSRNTEAELRAQISAALAP